ncbi:MAG: carbamoyltransferase, partial [Planctomycetes bacterium]|nr:carbamoyltransferase [Planctomycetota bacterium]
IKFRDFWMPFTPSILAGREGDYAVNPKNLASPFMTMAFDSTPLAREHLPAAMHPADFTIRPQFLTESANPEYYALIKAFERRTGVGALLNTSFNLHGEPMVCGPKEAIRTFENSGLDMLLMNDVLVSRAAS